MKAVLTQANQQQEVTFQDKSEEGGVTEVEIEFTRYWDDDLPTTCDFTSGGWGGLHERVIEVVDRALEQLPNDKPTLVIIASTGWVGLDEISMIAAMFSLPKVTYPISTEPGMNKQEQELTAHYNLQGIVQESVRTRLSAVGVWHQKWTKEPSGVLDIYHNPLAAKQIPYHVLELPNVCQLVPKGEGIMEWIPGRPSE